MWVTKASDNLLKRLLNREMDIGEGYEYEFEELRRRIYNFMWDELQSRYWPDNELNVCWWQMKALVECNVVISDNDFRAIASTYWENTRELVKIYKQYKQVDTKPVEYKQLELF